MKWDIGNDLENLDVVNSLPEARKPLETSLLPDPFFNSKALAMHCSSQLQA
jgi:hypothetical protein